MHQYPSTEQHESIKRWFGQERNSACPLLAVEKSCEDCPLWGAKMLNKSASKVHYQEWPLIFFSRGLKELLYVLGLRTRKSARKFLGRANSRPRPTITGSQSNRFFRWSLHAKKRPLETRLARATGISQLCCAARTAN